ncbi:16S rRNA (cytidine(1402)-2'-O)-methyltransferase [candidate division KSB1 bacterium]|nr:16S rRNA (cytidine(1402)-2'-O)-methyltransferase [candidate division KSB1 bacterium]
MIERGTLYLVSTPIGNLRDITLRALDILGQVDIVAAEDTRQSRILLQHYRIDVPLIRYHEHNEEKMASRIVIRLQEGATVALLTDAGTPGISDPGFYLVRAALQAGLQVMAIPGATAFLPALVSSGLPCEKFVFEGFLPHKKGRQKRLQQLREETRTMIFYESPMRVERTLQEFLQVFGDRPAAVARELTKKFEQIIRGSLKDIVDHWGTFPIKGEFVLVIGGADKKRTKNQKTDIP